MNSIQFNQDLEQSLPRTKKSVDFIKTLPILPNQFIPLVTPTRVKISKILRVLRPMIHCIALVIKDKASWGTLSVSILVDVISILLVLGF